MKIAAVLVLALCAGGQALAQKGGNNQNFTMEDFLRAGYRIRPEPPPEPPPPEPPKRELGPIDRWRFESCQSDAAKAPTELGVKAGLRVCREKFGQ